MLFDQTTPHPKFFREKFNKFGFEMNKKYGAKMSAEIFIIEGWILWLSERKKNTIEKIKPLIIVYASLNGKILRTYENISLLLLNLFDDFAKNIGKV